MGWHRHHTITAAIVVLTTVLVVAAAAASVALGAPVAQAKKAKVQARIHDRTLEVTGTSAGETIALRLRSGDPSILEVVVGGGSAADFDFRRARFDRVEVRAGDGDDVLTIDESNGSFTDTEATTLDGEAGNDTLRGGSSKETFAGGDGNDFVDGNRGDDVGFLGAGDDTFQWDPGDGSDVVEGQDGTDRMLFNGANVAERFDLAANGGRLRFFRDIANITMDTDGLEIVDIRTLGGADRVTVHDLSGTDVTSVRTDLAGAPGGGDGAADHVIVEGTAGDDVIDVAGSAGAATVSGLAAAVSIANAESAADALTLNALAGDDVIEATGLAANVLALTAEGGDGDDVLIGSAGADVLRGEAGDDVLLGGPGIDTLDGGPGNNIILQD